MEIRKISYLNSTDEKMKIWVEYIIEKIILQELETSNTNKVELHVSKYFHDKNNN